jgi:hypothetical protein
MAQFLVALLQLPLTDADDESRVIIALDASTQNAAASSVC